HGGTTTKFKNNHLRERRDMNSTLRRFFPGLDRQQLEAKRKSIYKWEQNRTAIEDAYSFGRQRSHRNRAQGTGTILSCYAEARSGAVGVCQPAVISWNMPLKSRLRAAWVTYLQAQLRLPTFQPAVLAPKRGDVLNWIDATRKGLSQSVIAGGFALYAKPSDADAEGCMTDKAYRCDELDLIDTSIGTVSEDDDAVDALLRLFEDALGVEDGVEQSLVDAST
ncbi:TPA: hypothetical protein N0F65_006041, partial [Lagenidium giganteum]